ncbi:unnamed protein product [Prunus armeniaca]
MLVPNEQAMESIPLNCIVKPLEEPEKMTNIILQALEITGQRGVIIRGWVAEPSDSVYLVDNCPHDWLFQRCSAVVHHGVAGTTAAGLKAACPTTIVPFFGDQLFWGERVHARGVGPAPIPADEFSLEKLVDAISFMLDPKAMDGQDEVTRAVNAFHRHFPHNKSLDKPESLLARRGLFSIRRYEVKLSFSKDDQELLKPLLIKPSNSYTPMSLRWKTCWGISVVLGVTASPRLYSLKIKQVYVLSLEFFNWVAARNPTSLTLETHSMILHSLTKYRRLKSAESILRKILVSGSIDLPSKLFEAILFSYRLCDSSPRVYYSLFKTFAHMKKFRNATNTFCQMKDYGFFPTVESCNAYLSSLLRLHRADIALVFYREMQRCRISPNVYTLNMVISAYCKLGKLENAVEGLLSSALKFKNLMLKNGLYPNVVTFNSLIGGLCKSMIRSGYHPDEHTFKMLISNFCNNRDFDGAVEVLKEMFERSIALHSSILSDLCLGLYRCGNAKM